MIKKYSSGEGVGVITSRGVLDELSVFEIFFFSKLRKYSNRRNAVRSTVVIGLLYDSTFFITVMELLFVCI